MANDADVRLRPPKDITAPAPAKHAATSHRIKGDHRLPPPGTIITRAYKGTTLRVMVRADGFEFEGERYKSLSALAKVITGQHCNSFRFFQFGKEYER